MERIQILLIEDNPGDAKLVEIFLRESTSIDFDLVHATRLSEGLEHVKQGKRFDIMLLDLSLPDSSGFDTLTKAIKNVPHTVSIVVLTGLDDESVGVKAVKMGAQDYLVKGQIDTSSLTRSVLHAIERRRMQLKVEESEKRFRHVFEDSQDAIYITTPEGQFSDFNQSLLKMFGYTREEFTSLTKESLFDDKESLDIFNEELERTGVVKDFEARLKRKNGSVLDCLFTSTAWRSIDGELTGYHGMIRDVTIRKKTQELEKAKQIAERSAMLKGQFLDNMSHEIRTPMNVVIGMTHLLEHTALTNKQQEYIRALKLSADNLLKLINSILDFSKIEAGKLELELQPIRIQDLIQDLVQQHKYKAKENKINLFTQLDVSLPDKVIGDSVRLYSVLNNLVSNAIKYTDKGEVLIRVEVLDESSEFAEIKFSVRDTGIGIPEDKQATVFESFEQAHGAANRGGTGLGLSIVKKIVELFGGEMELESEYGRGSTFSFHIKFEKYIESEYAVVTNDSKGSNERDDLTMVYTSDNNIKHVSSKDVVQDVREKIDILLVEDHKLNQLVATDLIHKWSPNVNLQIADNGRIAIDMLQEFSAYDVILMDISMPEMDGYETTEYIRNKFPSPTKDIPIIAMTAHAFKKNAQKCFDMGMDEFVAKPIDPNILYKKLNKILADKLSAISQDYATNKDAAPKMAQKPQTKSPKIINFEYLDTLTSGQIDVKITFLETLIRDMPQEIATLMGDFEHRNWEKVKQSAHKLKSTCGYLGLAETVELCRTVENNAWEQKNLDEIGGQIKKIDEVCRIAHEQLKDELANLTQSA
ncbi:MAG: response regulator [Chitinophagales bacterium]